MHTHKKIIIIITAVRSCTEWQEMRLKHQASLKHLRSKFLICIHRFSVLFPRIYTTVIPTVCRRIKSKLGYFTNILRTVEASNVLFSLCYAFEAQYVHLRYQRLSHVGVCVGFQMCLFLLFPGRTEYFSLVGSQFASYIMQCAECQQGFDDKIHRWF